MDSPVADDPAEPTSRNEHESQAIVKDELEGLRHTVVGQVPDGLKTQTVPVEIERPAAVGGRKCDNDGRGDGHGCPFRWMTGPS
jgi:hypothetical protein